MGLSSSWKFLPFDSLYDFAESNAEIDIQKFFNSFFLKKNGRLSLPSVAKQMKGLFTISWNLENIWTQLNSCLNWLLFKNVEEKTEKIEYYSHGNQFQKFEYKYYKLEYLWTKILYDPYRATFVVDLIKGKKATIVLDQRHNLLDENTNINSILIDDLEEIFQTIDKIADYYLSAKKNLSDLWENDQYVVLNFNTRQCEFYPKNQKLEPFFVGLDTFCVEEMKSFDVDCSAEKKVA